MCLLRQRGAHIKLISAFNFMSLNSLTEKEITSHLDAFPRTGPINEFPDASFDRPPRPAAVLILFLRQDEEWHLLFIRRTEYDGDRHSGQVAFPSGAIDPEDNDAKAAALREAHEEIGLLSEDVQILGQLHDFITISNFHVTPFVGVMPWPYSISPSSDEVSRVFTIPLEWLADPTNHRTENRNIPGWDKQIPVIYFEEYDGELLWGVSAQFTLSLLQTLNII